ncbi:MAG: C4-dicarboxylate-specific signal transduction histidine kinase [Bacteriovoracaceae bacterium]|jgi:C4-dicarboxylate-specific signal transduction histidine kinase
MFFGIDTSSFMPHGHCILWSPEILIPMVIAEALIIISYFLIPVAIFVFIKRREDLTSHPKRILYLFISFIFFCGLTHVISLWNYWNSDYILETFVKLITGVVSFATVVVIVKNFEGLIALTNVKNHNKVLDEIRDLNLKLEEKVQARTKELEEEYRKITAILKGSNDGIVLYTPKYNLDGVVVDFSNKILNEMALTLMGVKNFDEIETDSILRDFPHIKENGHFEDCIQVLNTGMTITRDPVFNPTTKTYTRITVSKKELSDKVLVFFTDVTEREDLKLNILATSKLAAIGELAGGVAHEINTPLQILDGNIRQLKREINNEEKATTIIEEINAGKERIKNIVKNLKRLSRNETSSTAAISSEDLLSMIHNFISLRLDFKGVEHEIIKDFSEDFEVSFIEISLSQILNNLITNAIDEMQEADQGMKKVFVTVSAKKDEDHISIFVEDTGDGIKEEHIEKIFDPLFTTKDVGKGTGLGLSISKRLALDMGGDLKYVRSDRTRFELSLKRIK